MFLAPVRVLEVSPPRPRKKGAADRQSSCFTTDVRLLLFPCIPLSLSSRSPSRLFLRCVSGVEPTREHQFFSALSDVCLIPFRPPPSPPPPSRSFASVGFPRSWLCHLVPDGRSFPLSLPPTSPFNPGRSLGSSIMVLSAPLGPAHAENGYPSFLRAHHLSPDADQELETLRPFLQPSQV